MISVAQMEQHLFQLIQKLRLNYIITAPPTSRDQQWIKSDKLVISWILASCQPTITDCVLDYTNTTHKLWIQIHTFLEPILLPLVNDLIQHEIVSGRNIKDKIEEEKSKPINNQTQNRDKDHLNPVINNHTQKSNTKITPHFPLISASIASSHHLIQSTISNNPSYPFFKSLKTTKLTILLKTRTPIKLTTKFQITSSNDTNNNGSDSFLYLQMWKKAIDRQKKH